MGKHNRQIIDFAVIGGGPAGLVCTLALASAGHRVCLMAPPARKDNRTSALMMPSIRMLERLGVWEGLEESCAALEVMRLVDDTGRLLRAPTLNFRARDIQDSPFGWNIPNALLMQNIMKLLQKHENVELIPESCAGIEHASDTIICRSETGTSIVTRHVVAADGRNSATRAAAGITASWWDHPQTALTTTLRHDRPHQGVSTELHRKDGPFTLVPMPGNRSSLVWVEAPAEAKRITALSPQLQTDLIFRISRGLLGRVEMEGDLQAFPLKTMRVSAHARQRVFLVGETAHVFPPIGAQGLNLTMRDIGYLVDIFAGKDGSGGLPRRTPEDAYSTARATDTWSRTYGVNLLNFSLLLPYLPVQMARTIGLGALSASSALRNRAMRAGMAPAKLPALMRVQSA